VRRTLAVVALVAAACQSAPASTPKAAPPSPPPTPSAAAPTLEATAAAIPAGRILFHRQTPDGIQHYFTIKADGMDPRALYEAEGCECAHWAADGLHVMTLGATGHGTWSFTTYLFDGTEKTLVRNPIPTLNLAPGATSADGRLIAFNGWDESNPANTGLYVASPDLSDLRLVLPLQEGWLAVEPFGVSPDRSRIVFFVETGPDGDIDHAGDHYVIGVDGTGLRRLSPADERTPFVGMPTISLSPDGRRAAFTTHETVYVVDLEGGDARPITTQPGFAWAASWSPNGDWITYTRFHGRTSVIALVRPDGTEHHEISAHDETDEANAGVFSPDGKHLLVIRDSDASVDGPQDLWIMDLEGHYLGQVTHEPSKYGTYSWAPSPR
jgi:Tol biopolymer transport system component